MTDLATRRIQSENYDAVVGSFSADNYSPEGHQGFPVSISIARLHTGEVHEIMFLWCGTQDNHMHRILRDLGIATSRAIQERNPDSGEPL